MQSSRGAEIVGWSREADLSCPLRGKPMNIWVPGSTQLSPEQSPESPPAWRVYAYLGSEVDPVSPELSLCGCVLFDHRPKTAGSPQGDHSFFHIPDENSRRFRNPAAALERARPISIRHRNQSARPWRYPAARRLPNLAWLFFLVASPEGGAPSKREHEEKCIFIDVGSAGPGGLTGSAAISAGFSSMYVPGRFKTVIGFYWQRTLSPP